MPTTEPISPDAARAVAAQRLLTAYHLPAGVKTIIGYLLTNEAPPTVARMGFELGRCDRTVASWIEAAKAAGLLKVGRTGRRNTYEVCHEALKHLAERGGE